MLMESNFLFGTTSGNLLSSGRCLWMRADRCNLSVCACVFACACVCVCSRYLSCKKIVSQQQKLAGEQKAGTHNG